MTSVSHHNPILCPHKTEVGAQGVDLINFLEFYRSNRKKIRSNFVLWRCQQVHWTVDPTKTLYNELKLNVWIEIDSIYLIEKSTTWPLTVFLKFKNSNSQYLWIGNEFFIQRSLILYKIEGNWWKIDSFWVMCRHWIQNGFQWNSDLENQHFGKK